MRRSAMNRRQVVLAAGLTAFLVLTAAVGAPSAADDQRLTGSWFGTATATSVPLPPLKDLVTFTVDGNVVEAHRLFLADSPLGPLLATPGHGTWAKTGTNEFAATLMIIYEGAEKHPTAAGQVLATEKVRFKLHLRPNRNELSGTLVDEIRDTSGTVVFEGPGVYEATRIAVEPLPSTLWEAR
jgi:hypothetical protein